MASSTDPPRTAEEVESLVLRFYQPNSPEDNADIDTRLKALQVGPFGWQLGNELLRSREKQVRFFGASTLTVKINTDWDSLAATEHLALLANLLAWLLLFTPASDEALITRKLCSTLAAYFVKATGWRFPVRHLILCYLASQVTLEPAKPFPAVTVTKLSEAERLVVFCLMTSLAETVHKLPHDTIGMYHVHKRYMSSLQEDILPIIELLADHGIAQECFSVLIEHPKLPGCTLPPVVAKFRAIFGHVISSLRDDELCEKAGEICSDMMTRYPRFLLAGDWARLATYLSDEGSGRHIEAVRRGSLEGGTIAFVELLIEFARCQRMVLIKEPDKYPTIIKRLTDVFECDNAAILDGETCDVCSRVVDFWAGYAEDVCELRWEDEEEDELVEWLQPARTTLGRVIGQLLPKLDVPSHIEPGTEEFDNIRTFRQDVKHFVNGTYPIVRATLVSYLVSFASNALENRLWMTLESAMFCLNGLAETIAEDGHEDDKLSRLLTPRLFLTMCDMSLGIPHKPRTTAVVLVDRYAKYFHRHSESVIAAFQYLFAVLEAGPLPLSRTAAKAIHTLGSSCRKELKPLLNELFGKYRSLIAAGLNDAPVKERLLAGIAAIVEALPFTEQLVPFGQLLDLVGGEVGACIGEIRAGRAEEAYTIGLGVLQSLVSIGKSMQAPVSLESPIDLDVDEGQTLWDTGLGRPLQQQVIESYTSIMALPIMGRSGDAVAATCDILRTGYPEKRPGPFVLPPSATSNLFLGRHPKSPRMDYVLETVGIMLRRKSRDVRTNDVVANATACLVRVVEFCALETSDPDVASSLIDVLEVEVAYYLDIVLGSSGVDICIQFTIASLVGADILPKQSAAAFWVTLLTCSGQSPALHSQLQGLIAKHGPLLSIALLKQVSGDARRSELESLAGPIKKLVIRGDQAKRWFADAFASPAFQGCRVDDAQKNMFLLQLFSVRGKDRESFKIIRDFWMACRGTTLVA